MPSRLTPILLLLTVACSHPPAEQATPLRSPEGFVVAPGPVRLYYTLTGSGPDTVVVLHGGPGLNLEGLRPDLVPLEAHHVLLYYDQRGSGRSDLGDTLGLTVDAMIEDLEAVRQAFRFEQLTLLAHSWGGGLALRYAVRYPDRVRRMVLVSPFPPRGAPYLAQYEANQASRRDSADVRSLAALGTVADSTARCRELLRLGRRVRAGSSELATRVHGDFCAGAPDHLARLGLVMRRVLQPFGTYPDLVYDWRPEVAGLSIPTLILQGVEDPLPLASAEEWATALPEARLIPVAGAGHYPYAEVPEQFFPPVEAFLSGPAPRPRQHSDGSSPRARP